LTRIHGVEKKIPQKKEKSEWMYCFEVLDVLELEGFPVSAIKDLQATGKASSRLKSS
jgi:hypothetical protein